MALFDAPAIRHSWTFLTNHAHVLIAISRNRYEIGRGIALRHPLEQHHTIDELLATLES